MRRIMRILLVSDLYPPEVSSTADLMADLARALGARGHDVTVLTTWPGYKLDSTRLAQVFTEDMKEEGVRVLRIRTLPMRNVSFFRRGIGTFAAPFQLWRGLKRHSATRYDATFIYSTPITYSFIGGWLRRRGARFLFNVQDIFPQNAIDLGVLRDPLAIALYRWVERRAYRIADVITAHSEGNRDQLVKVHPAIGRKLHILHNWIDEYQFIDGPPGENFRELFRLQGKLVGVYGGVIGIAQGLEVIIDVADRVREIEDLVFLIVGDGTERPTLEKRIQELELKNVVLQPFVARERYSSLLRSADFGFLTLSPKMKTPVVPGKLLGYMAAGLPVLAIANKESDAHRIVAEAGCGYSVCPSDVDEIAGIVRKFYAERARLPKLGSLGRAYAKAHFSQAVIVDQIEDLLSAPRG